MTVRDLIRQLANCDMDSTVVLVHFDPDHQYVETGDRLADALPSSDYDDVWDRCDGGPPNSIGTRPVTVLTIHGPLETTDLTEE